MDKFLQDHPSKPRTKDEKQKVINRLKRIEGQVRGIQKMVEEDRYCVDILVQISAIQSALKKMLVSLSQNDILTIVLVMRLSKVTGKQRLMN